MALRLIKATHEYEKQIINMLQEWTFYNQTHPGCNQSPYSIFKNDYQNFDFYIEHLEIKYPQDNLVPDSTFFCFDEERNLIVGAVNIRHTLNDDLVAYGGHIGDGIRPSERRKGYATKMISLALEKCKNLGISKVLLVCDKTNIGSAKSIIKNNGILENEVEHNGKIIQRYWINIQ